VTIMRLAIRHEVRKKSLVLFSIFFLICFLFQFHSRQLTKTLRTKFLMDRVPVWLEANQIGSIRFQKINPPLLFMAIPVEVLLVQSKVSSRVFLMKFKDVLGIQLQNCMNKVVPSVSKADTKTMMTSLVGHAGAESSYAIFLSRLSIADEFFVKHMKAAGNGEKPIQGLAEFPTKLSDMVKMIIDVYRDYLAFYKSKIKIKVELTGKAEQDQKLRKLEQT
jgi:hypothetical protein